MPEGVPSEVPPPGLPADLSAGGGTAAPRPTATRRMGTSSLPSIPPRAPGERFGAYELTRKIAESGLGEIFQARPVAGGDAGILKRLKAERAGSAIARARFECEMELGRTLQHEHLVTVRDTGVVQDRPFLFMQEIKGPSLRTVLQGLAPWAATADLMLGALAQVGDALVYVHAAGVVHNDVKPGNVLFESPHKAVLIDFGLAYRQQDGGGPGGGPGGTALRPTTEAPMGYIVGTPVYLPPERLRGEPTPPTPATDVYAFGVMLYEVLAGRPPFVLEGEGDHSAQLARLVRAVVNTELPPLTQFNPQVAPAWEELCGRCLDKKPQRRPQSLRPVVADLRSILATGQPTAGTAGGLVKRMTRWLLKGGRTE